MLRLSISHAWRSDALRSAFSLYKPLLTDAEAERLKDELRWLAGTLGDARNLDVLLVKAKDDDMHDRLKKCTQRRL